MSLEHNNSTRTTAVMSGDQVLLNEQVLEDEPRANVYTYLYVRAGQKCVPAVYNIIIYLILYYRIMLCRRSNIVTKFR
jgi:hypothetical protein